MTFPINSFFSCDALSLLERLPSETVTLAYLEPPWNTGSTFERATTTFGSSSDHELGDYLSKVLQQLHRLLTDQGSVFLHWSPQATLDMRLVGSQAFGCPPRYEITRVRRPFGRFQKNAPKVDHEFLLVYSKSEDFIYNTLYRPLTSDEKKTRYTFKDDRGTYAASIMTIGICRPTFQFVWRGYRPEPTRSWAFPEQKLEDLARDGRIHFPSSGGLPRLKRYLADHPGMEIGTTWDDIPPVAPRHERTAYPFQQPLSLIDRIVRLASEPGNQVLDPFCGSGTTLVAAQALGRHWWGVDSWSEAKEIVVERLAANFGLQSNRDYAVLNDEDIAKFPIVSAAYTDAITRVAEITQLQEGVSALATENTRLEENVSELTGHLLSLKMAMNIGENDDAGTEQIIQQMQNWIAKKITTLPNSADYIKVVCAWLTGWESLDSASQSFLPQAEQLFENNAGQDYSPFILQYCRALENELLTKLFSAYTDDFYIRHEEPGTFLANEKTIKGTEKDGKFPTTKFVSFLEKRSHAYTLGDMAFIMGLLKPSGKTLQRSALLQDLRDFASRHFNERIIDRSYLEQIERINKDFRCKAAHPNVLDQRVAERCREQVRACLNELILNYRGANADLLNGKRS